MNVMAYLASFCKGVSSMSSGSLWTHESDNVTTLKMSGFVKFGWHGLLSAMPITNFTFFNHTCTKNFEKIEKNFL